MRSKTVFRAAVCLLVVFCVAAVTGYFGGGEALALPPNEVETYFYSDATLTHQVGWKLLMCDGSRYQTGTTSQYRAVYSYPCGNGSPSCWCIYEGMQGECPSYFDCENF